MDLPVGLIEAFAGEADPDALRHELHAAADPDERLFRAQLRMFRNTDGKIIGSRLIVMSRVPDPGIIPISL